MTNYLKELKNATSAKDQEKALEAFYRETSSLAFSYCRKKGLNSQDSEDIVQIVYTQIYNKRLKYNPDYSPLAWLFIICKSETKDYLKKSATYGDYLADYNLFIQLSQNQVMDPSNQQEPMNIPDYANILNAQEKLAIEQRYFSEKDFSEIAATLGVTETNVRKIISRALHKLRG